MPLSHWLLLFNFAATWFMVGLIWFVQVAHYPQFAEIGSERFAGYHNRHTILTTRVVGPPMLVEAVSAVWLVFQRPPQVAAWMMWFGVALVLAVWTSTALLQVPHHNRLAKAFEANEVRGLCASNWIRTAAWSIRGGLMLAAVAMCL